jgi:2-methylisocitrate lyase-like PEP mutase family enzyme
VSATLLGEPDLGLLTPPEMARKAGQIIYSIPNVPVLVDADTGALFVVHGASMMW